MVLDSSSYVEIAFTRLSLAHDMSGGVSRRSVRFAGCEHGASPPDCVASPLLFQYLEFKADGRADNLSIHLTPEQEQRVQAVVGRGAYDSAEQVVDAALAAVEQRTLIGFVGKDDELNTLLTEGLASPELSEVDFWASVNAQTNSLLASRDNRRLP